MSAQFDPYHRWFGIPPEKQPANHYALLGIEPFEDNPDVIESAADQRMAHLRNFQTGEHGKLSQKLLNEVAAAKICLFSPSKRAAYDRKLRAEIEAKKAVLPKAEPLTPATAGQPVRGFPGQTPESHNGFRRLGKSRRCTNARQSLTPSARPKRLH